MWRSRPVILTTFAATPASKMAGLFFMPIASSRNRLRSSSIRVIDYECNLKNDDARGRMQAAENRETVINVASRLFRERGFDGIGLKDLMKEPV